MAAAIALAGCNQNDLPTNGRAMAPLSERMLADIKDKKMDKESPILVRLFKEESELEVWKQNQDGQYALLKTYPICRWSGELGPKKKEGDRQAPEGFYTITPGQMNPNSSYYLAFNTGFPNAYDRAHNYTGSELMVHGDCTSRGCYAMTDEQIQEIYALARESFFGGQKSFQLQAFPFRMTALNMAKHRNSPHFAFWKMLKEGYDHFEATNLEPKVAVCEKRYVFDPAAPDGATKPLSFNPKGACPAYQLDRNIADAVLEHRRQEQRKMAQYIADGVSVVAMRPRDGGSNPVFADKIGTQEQYDAKGRVVHVATAPGSLPKIPNPPGAYNFTPRPQATAVAANVPVPPTAPLPKEGEAPAEQTSVASLFGGLFSGGAQSASQPSEPAAEAEPAAETVALRGTNTDLTAKPKPAAIRTAAAPTPPAKPAATPKMTVIRSAAAEPAPTPERKPEVKQAAQQPAQDSTPSAPAQQMRTAFSDAPPPSRGMLSGAQPVVPAGSFAQRWSGMGFR
ncbi:MAG: L,D-transpeptidase family protein [Pseudolabrys sp.]